jgi:hypothetical protein
MRESKQFYDALWQLHRERGGGWIPTADVRKLAATMRPRMPPIPMPPIPRPRATT